MASADYPELLRQLRAVAQTPPTDESTRQEVANALREAELALESPVESVRRIAYTPLQLVMATVAIDLGIFEKLGAGESGMAVSLNELVASTSAERDLLERILRYLVTAGMIAQAGKAAYVPTNIGRTLRHPGFAAGIKHHFEAQLPSWLALPSFLASISYSPARSDGKTAFQRAHNTNLSPFQFATSRPRLMYDFAQWMAVSSDCATWLDAFTHAELDPPALQAADTPFFVDVGGGLGHQCRAIRAWLPSEARRAVVSQDLPEVVKRADGIDGVEMMEHDFWGEQPVKGAAFYYLRHVLHDYDDGGCRRILRNILNAMGKGSFILIDELVLPETIDKVGNEVVMTASMDILLFASLGGKERTLPQWTDLVKSAGLDLKEIRGYGTKGDSVMVAIPS